MYYVERYRNNQSPIGQINESLVIYMYNPINSGGEVTAKRDCRSRDTLELSSSYNR